MTPCERIRRRFKSTIATRGNRAVVYCPPSAHRPRPAFDCRRLTAELLVKCHMAARLTRFARRLDRAGPDAHRRYAVDPKPVLLNESVDVAEYDYCDEAGERLFQSERFDPRTLPAAARATVAGIGRLMPSIPYRLPQPRLSCRRVVVVEGEKDGDNLTDMAFGDVQCRGAGKWTAQHANFARPACT
jgi:hypothetical protein